MIVMRRATFVGHDIASAETASAVLKRLKMPTELVDTVHEAIRLHMRGHNLEKSKKVHKIRRLLGKDVIDVLVELGDADEKATVAATGQSPLFFREAVARAREKWPEMLPARLVTGDDLIRSGFEPGEGFKEALDVAFDAQLDGETDKTKLLRRAINVLKQKDSNGGKLS
jgi:hypothetical protein